MGMAFLLHHEGVSGKQCTIMHFKYRFIDPSNARVYTTRQPVHRTP